METKGSGRRRGRGRPPSKQQRRSEREEAAREPLLALQRRARLPSRTAHASCASPPPCHRYIRSTYDASRPSRAHPPTSADRGTEARARQQKPRRNRLGASPAPSPTLESRRGRRSRPLAARPAPGLAARRGRLPLESSRPRDLGGARESATPLAPRPAWGRSRRSTLMRRSWAAARPCS